MPIELIPEWQLTIEDEAQIAALLARCFDTDFGGRSYFKQRHHLRLLWRDEGHIIGHMALTYRAVRLGAKLVDIVGLAEVSCAPEHRGKCIASALLQRSIAEAKASPAAFFLLFGTAALYAGAGCRPAGNPITYVEMLGARTGAVKSEPAETLQVLALRDTGWDGTAPLDLLGTLF